MFLTGGLVLLFAVFQVATNILILSSKMAAEYDLLKIPLFFNHNANIFQYGMKYHTPYTSTAASHSESGHKLVFSRVLHGGVN